MIWYLIFTICSKEIANLLYLLNKCLISSIRGYYGKHHNGLIVHWFTETGVLKTILKYGINNSGVQWGK